MNEFRDWSLNEKDVFPPVAPSPGMRVEQSWDDGQSWVIVDFPPPPEVCD